MSVIFDAFLTSLFGLVWSNFGVQKTSQISLKSVRKSIVGPPFFRTRFELDLGVISDGSEPEKQ